MTKDDNLRFAIRLIEAIKSYTPSNDINTTTQTTNQTTTNQTKTLTTTNNVDLNSIKILLKVGADNLFEWYTDSEGKTPLHHAVINGHLEIIHLLIQEAGHPWTPLDIFGKTAADYALDLNHLEIYAFLLDEATRSELLLNSLNITGQNSGESSIDSDCDQNTTDTNGQNTTDTDGQNTTDTNGQIEYLDQGVEYLNGVLVDDEGDAVMMRWEAPLMLKHAQLVCQFTPSSLDTLQTSETNLIDKSLLNMITSTTTSNTTTTTSKTTTSTTTREPFRVLNVGFGMGIIDTFIHQLLYLKSKHENRKCIHYIIEAHPGVLQKMKQFNWITSNDTTDTSDTTTTTNDTNDTPTTTTTKDSVELVVYEGKWQNVIDEIINSHIEFDGIFFDTFGEKYDALKEWHERMVDILKATPDSKYSFFNGLGGHNRFFNHLYSNIVDIELRQLGLGTEWVDIHVDKDSHPEDWKGIKSEYFQVEKYRFPICSWLL